ncbi:hypothetical protein [Amycolatopsis keratiniphila]|uniref:Uncharacterized protein n=1 Tax=Amycolatopsis keratiniphila TaxID=129921 RepID=W6HZJ1_9PSEU|nr:hypothetical protein [Amycolatopsis keratiniphila]AHJ58547.1 hypothetical protein AORI_P032 [Amycolatopsis keratiniphila]
MTKNSLPTARDRAIEGTLTRTDKAISYLGWHAPELIAIALIALTAGIFAGWLLVAALLPLGYAAYDDIERFRANRKEQRRRELRAATRKAAEDEVAIDLDALQDDLAAPAAVEDQDDDVTTEGTRSA